MYSTPIWQPNWKNLMVWLKAYHAGIVHGRCPQPVHLLEQSEQNPVDLHWYLVGIMFDVAKAMRGSKWVVVEAIMVSSRPALIAADKGWKD